MTPKIVTYETKEKFLSDKHDDSFIYLIKDSNEVYTHEGCYKRYDWDKIGTRPVRGDLAKTLDVVFANKKTLDLVIDGDWSIEKYPKDIWEPIGIVVIPGEHGVLKDGTGTKNQCGIMSLVPMNCKTPEIGGNIEEYITWGYDDLDIEQADGLNRYDSINNGLINYTKIACDISASNSSTRLNNDAWAYLPVQSSIEEKPTWDKQGASSRGYIPSPYINDDLKSGGYNEAYGTTKFDTEIDKNVLADFKGIINTKIITDLATAEDWKTLPSITDEFDQGYYPAACCCARFHTIGTKAFKDCSNEELKKGIGFWYLPAIGELGYICPRYSDINDTINKLNKAYGVGVQLGKWDNYMSSSEYNAYDYWQIYVNLGQVESYPKTFGTCIRAFMRL